jgi:outer membrane protein assembly factor BamB
MSGTNRRRAATAVLVLVMVGFAASCSVYEPGWSTIHADSRNSDYSPVAGVDDLELAWSQTLNGTINVGATQDRSGRVYVTSTEAGCHLAALDPATGQRIWCSGTKLDRFAVISSALVDHSGRLFVADGTAMHAFDANGNVLWETPIEGVPLSAQFTPNGRVLFITHIGRIYVLRRETGAPVLPMVELVPGATWDPAQGVLACAQGTAACPSANTLAMDTTTGRFIFTFWRPGAPQAGVVAMRVTESPTPALVPLWENTSLPGGSASSPTVSEDGSRVYVNDNVDRVHALDANTGASIWSFPIGYASGGSPSLTPGGKIMPAGGGGAPLLAIQDEGDHASLVWKRDDLVNRGIPTQVAGDRSYATVGAGGFVNAVVVIDTETGAELDRTLLPGTTYFTVGTTVSLDGTVYVPALNGTLFAFRPA